MSTETVQNLLTEAYCRFYKGDQLGYDEVMVQAKANIGTDAGERWLLGEWKLASSLAYLREPAKLIRIYDEAIRELDGRRSRIYDASTTFCFSDDSLFWMMMREPGQADKTGPQFAKAAERFQTLTGCGLGFSEFYQAELAYLRGDLVRARTLAYQANYIAKSTQQPRLVLLTSKAIGRIATHLRDATDWSYALESCTPFLKPEDAGETMAASMRSAGALAYTELMLQLDEKEPLPSWVKEGSFNVTSGVCICNLKYAIHDDPNIQSYDYPYALWLHALYLLHAGQYARALAVDAVQRMFGIEKEFLCYQLYYSLLRGSCYQLMGDRERAKDEFYTAVEMAVPDGLWLTVAEFASVSGGLILEAVKDCGGDVAEVRRLAHGFVNNSQKLKEAVMGQDIDRLLTAREREIAHLAAKGMRNREIADQLSVTEQTVKFHLSNIYSKLDIDNRAKLAAMLKSTVQRLY